MNNFGYLSSALVLGCLPSLVSAHCERVTDTHQLSATAIAAGYNAQSWAGANNAEARGQLGLPGVVTLGGNNGVQKEGSLLASSAANFVNSGRSGGYGSRQVLFKCDKSDRGSLYEFFATNGLDAHSGQQAVDSLDGAYYTRVKNVALRLTNQKSGQYYSRQWQKRAIAQDDTFDDGQHVYIPASAFSDVFVELLKVENGNFGVEGSSRDSYNYDTPSGYIAFQGGGISQGLTEGADSAASNDGRSLYWPGGWSLAHQTRFQRYVSCQLDDYPGTVLFPAMNTAALKGGAKAEANFSISVACTNITEARRDTSNTGFYMGFVAHNRHSADETLLLDTAYGGNNGVAQGVGIRLFSANDLTSPLTLLAPGTSAVDTGSDGWHALEELTPHADTLEGNISLYKGDFTASLSAFDTRTVTPGSVNAQVNIVVAMP